MTPFERTILRQLFADIRYAELVVPYLKDEYWFSPSAAHIYKVYRTFFEKFHTLPQFSVIRIGLDSVKFLSEREAKDAQLALTTIEQEPPLTADQDPWLIETTEEWVQDRAVYCGLQSCIAVMDDPKVSRHTIPDIMKTALTVSFDKSIGHDLFGDADARYDFYHKQEARIPFDLDVFNAMTKGGVPRKTLNVVMAGCVHPDTLVRIRVKQKC